jgi:hypothetical protein
MITEVIWQHTPDPLYPEDRKSSVDNLIDTGCIYDHLVPPPASQNSIEFVVIMGDTLVVQIWEALSHGFYGP